MDGLTCIDLESGSLTEIKGSDLMWETTTLTAAWLSAAVRAGKGTKVQLPFSHLKGATGVAGVEGDTLVVVISRTLEAALETSTGVLTLAVALHQEDGDRLWPLICNGAPCGAVASGLSQPAVPWCAVAAWRNEGRGEDLKWASDLARAIAWIWCRERGLVGLGDDERARSVDAGHADEPAWRALIRDEAAVWRAMRGPRTK